MTVVRVASCIAVTMFALSLPFSEALKWWSGGVLAVCALGLKWRSGNDPVLLSRSELLGLAMTAVLVFSCLESADPGMTLKWAWKTGSGVVVLWSLRTLSWGQPRLAGLFGWTLLLSVGVAVPLAAFSANHYVDGRLTVFSLGHSNYTATCLVIAAVFAFVLSLRAGHSRWEGMVAALLGIVMLTGLLLTRSRGAWFGGLAALAYFIAFKIHGLRGRILLVAAAVALFLLLPEIFKDRFLSIFSLEADHASFYPRLELWELGFRTYLQHPISGYGLGTFQYWCDFEDCRVPLGHLHSGYLQFLFEAGPFALMLLLAFLGSLMTELWRERMRTPFAEAAFLALIALMIHGVVAPTFRDEPLVLAMALAGLGISSGPSRKSGAPASQCIDPSQR